MAATKAAATYEDLTPYAAARREESGPPPGFVMYGATFVGEQVLRSASMLDLVERLQRDETLAYLGFLEDQLTEESWARFAVLFRDRATPVDTSGLDAAVGELLKGYTGRPTKGSSSSRPTPSKRGKSSKAGSSSAAKARRSR